MISTPSHLTPNAGSAAASTIPMKQRGDAHAAERYQNHRQCRLLPDCPQGGRQHRRIDNSHQRHIPLPPPRNRQNAAADGWSSHRYLSSLLSAGYSARHFANVQVEVGRSRLSTSSPLFRRVCPLKRSRIVTDFFLKKTTDVRSSLATSPHAPSDLR